MIFRAFPDTMPALWPQVSEVLAPVIAQTPTHTDEDVRLRCMSGAAHLWVQWNAPIVESAAVTEFVAYPRGLWLRIWLGACRPDCKQDSHGFLDEFKKWCEVSRCEGIEILGRHGWAKRFPEFTIEGVAMRWSREIAHGQE